MSLGRVNKRTRDQVEWDNCFNPDRDIKLSAEMLTNLLNEHPEIIISFMARFPQAIQNVISQHPEIITNSFSSDEFKNQVNNVITDDLLPTTEYELLDERLLEYDSGNTQYSYTISNVDLTKYSKYMMILSSKNSRGDSTPQYYTVEVPGKDILIEGIQRNVTTRVYTWKPVPTDSIAYIALTQIYPTGANQLVINYAKTSVYQTANDPWLSVYGVIEK